ERSSPAEAGERSPRRREGRGRPSGLGPVAGGRRRGGPPDRVALRGRGEGPGDRDRLADAGLGRHRRRPGEARAPRAEPALERHGGRIELTDGDTDGARYRVRLPVAPEATPHVAGEAGDDRTTREALDEVARQTVAELRPRPHPGIVHGGIDGRPLVLVVEDN